MTNDEIARELVWKWALRPNEDGKVFWKDRDDYFSFPDVQEQVADITTALDAKDTIIKSFRARLARAWLTLRNVVADLEEAMK